MKLLMPLSLALSFALAPACREAPPEIAPPEVSASTTPTDTNEPAQDVAPSASEEASAPTPPPSTDGWRTLAPIGEGFSVEVPSVPERKVSEVKGAQGHTAEIVQYNIGHGDTFFVVSASPLIEQLTKHGNQELALDRTLASQIDQPGRTVRFRKPITLGDATGREAEVDFVIEGQPVRLRIRLYLHDVRIYQALAIWPVTPDMTETPADVERFYASYKLTHDVSPDAKPIDLWQRFAVPELGLEVELPKKPAFEVVGGGNFLGGESVDTMSAFTEFPPSTYSIERVTVPEGAAEDSDKALLGKWKKALAASAPDLKFTTDESADLLGLKGKRFVVKKTVEGHPVEGYMIGVVERPEGAAPRVIVASMWAADPSAGEAEAKRFFESLERAP